MFQVSKRDFLVATYIFCILVSEILGAKTFKLVDLSWLHLNASVAVFFIPLIFSINDVFTEVLGVHKARQLVRLGFLVILSLSVVEYLAISLPPSPRFASTEIIYDKIFGSSLRLVLASLTSFILADLLDVSVFAKLRASMGEKALWFRNNASNFVGQFLDTTLFLSLAFYDPQLALGNNVNFLISLILPYWLLKTLMSVLSTPLVYLGVK